MSNNPDISKIINLIMENPQIIEQISNLAKNDSTKKSQDASPPESEPVNVQATPITNIDRKSNTRNELLRAMKPYLSESRGRAIDSMLSLSGILDVMKRG